MRYEVWIDPGFGRELDGLAQRERQAILDGLKGVAEHPLDHPQVVRVKGTSYPGSFRLRVGRHRVMGLALDGPRVILLTTVFLKKRESDYDRAVERHEGRLRLQGPPLEEYLKSARRRR